MVRSEGVELTIPEPGMGVSFEGVSALGTDPQHFQLEVSTDGVIRYPEPRAPEGGVESNNPAPAADPDACDDGANAWLDWSAYPTYKWYIGDGGMPGALSRSAAQKAFADAINNITASYNDCGLSDEVSVGHDYAGTTTYESDMTATGCAERDKVGTWDAGDLAVGTLAATCAWYFTGGGSFGQLEEADVRYNTKDYDFTNDPVAGPCTNKYDIRSVGTHEAGHVYGMAHVGNGHSNLTMYTNSFLCNTKARTLGKGDVLGLRKHY
ncbi:peptidase M10 [Streptomyces kanamyceticus]|nr:peptidase M10 [Streptomyces kanamyceticus]